MAKGLTKRQADILHYIVSSIRDDGMPPTIAEIGVRFSISSTNGVNDHLLALEKKGYIERSSKARSIKVTEKGAVGLYGAGAVMAPLVGRIAAGSPILAEENVQELVPVPSAIAEEGMFCLTVQGDSMIEAGILEGDTIMVDPNKKARRGDVVVALIEDEATAKRYYPDGKLVELRPENSMMESIIVRADRLQIQGVVVGLQRIL